VNEVAAGNLKSILLMIIQPNMNIQILENMILDSVNISQHLNYNFFWKKWNLGFFHVIARVKITRLDETNMRNNADATLKNYAFNLFRNAEYIINGKWIERIDYVGIKTTLFWYKDKTQTANGFKTKKWVWKPFYTYFTRWCELQQSEITLLIVVYLKDSINKRKSRCYSVFTINTIIWNLSRY